MNRGRVAFQNNERKCFPGSRAVARRIHRNIAHVESRAQEVPVIGLKADATALLTDSPPFPRADGRSIGMNVTSASLFGRQVTTIDGLQRNATVGLALERPRFPRTNRRSIRVHDAGVVSAVLCRHVFAFDLKSDLHAARDMRGMCHTQVVSAADYEFVRR